MTTSETRTSTTAYSAIVGLAAVVILFQAVWAGLFVKEGREYTQFWVEIHARGADLAIALAVVAAIVAFVRHRHRKDLIIGAAVLAVLLVLEAYLGGLIGGSPGVTALHFPIAMALMGLVVWLPFRAARR